MSQENVELVRAMLGAIGPDTDTDYWLDEFCDPEIEWHDVPTYPTAGVHSGREGRSAAMRSSSRTPGLTGASTSRTSDPRGIGSSRASGTAAWARESGAPITGGVQNPATGAIFELRAGRILRVRQFVTHAEALEAVGLSEQQRG